MDKEALQNELDELYIVRRKLLTGQAVEEVAVNTGGGPTRRVRKSAVRLADVESRIRSLESQLGTNTRARRRAIGVCF